MLCAYCGTKRDWPRDFPASQYARCFECSPLPIPPPTPPRAFLRSFVARWKAFVYQEDLMPEDLKNELADLFLYAMLAIFCGSLIIRLFFARH